jgi:SAM-dependent methyltransferase
MSCGLVYVDPQPRRRVREKYLRDYDLASHFGDVADRKRVLFERRLPRLGRPAQGANRLCDVGCGDGQFLELAARKGWDPHGIEPNPPAARRAREWAAVVFEGTVEELSDLPWESFDVVTAWDSIEHTPTPRRFVEILVSLLKPGGLLLITTLNRRSLAARLASTRWSLIVEDHFTYWDRRSLATLLISCGLEVEDVHFFGLGRDLVRWVDRLTSPRRAPSPAPGFGRSGTWSTAPAILFAEGFVNRLLDASGLGVGIEIETRRAEASA